MNLEIVEPSKLSISRTAGLFYTPELMQVPLLAGRKYKLAPVTVLFPLAVRRWITDRNSSRMTMGISGLLELSQAIKQG